MSRRPLTATDLLDDDRRFLAAIYQDLLQDLLRVAQLSPDAAATRAADAAGHDAVQPGGDAVGDEQRVRHAR